MAGFGAACLSPACGGTSSKDNAWRALNAVQLDAGSEEGLYSQSGGAGPRARRDHDAGRAQTVQDLGDVVVERDLLSMPAVLSDIVLQKQSNQAYLSRMLLIACPSRFNGAEHVRQRLAQTLASGVRRTRYVGVDPEVPERVAALVRLRT